MEKKRQKVVVLIRDGWGYRKEENGNALTKKLASVSFGLMEKYPTTMLAAAGEAVGLPSGYQGNSEVGHVTMGVGRVIFQPFAQINKSIREGDFFKKPELLAAVENCKKNKSALHIMGLLQEEGVHSHTDHLYALLDFCKQQGISNVFIHAFTDGRDTPPTAGIEEMKKLQAALTALGFGKIATISGRYYAMDRDKRWDRTKKAYDAIVSAEGQEFEDPVEKLSNYYSAGETDEFIVPSVVKGYEGVNPHDSIIFYNFRTDRTRQLTMAIVEKSFEGWDRKPFEGVFVCMTQYYSPVNALVVFKDQDLTNILGEVVSNAGLKQLRISETEKYAHVTFFFNGQKEEPFKNEERIMVPSQKVATYDLKPEMSAHELTDAIVGELKKGIYDLVVANLVNVDMVGHTGVLDAIYKAVKVVDECTGKVAQAGLENGYTTLILGDHGCAEDKTPENPTSHTTNPVPLTMVSLDPELEKSSLRQDGGFADVAPTVLDLLGVKKPEQMTGESLIIHS